MSICNFGRPQKKGRKVFRCMKLEELMAGEYSELAGTYSEFGRNKFYDGKNEILMQIPELKGLESK
jgi:hypothetical protein